MASPKSGSPCSLVAPAPPDAVKEADKDATGAISQMNAQQKERQAGKYGSEKTKPFKPPQTPEEKAKKKSWIEVQLVGEDDKPIPGEAYRITTPDGQVAEGSLDDKGLARLDGIEPGTCKITFPNLDKDAWKKA